MERAVKEAIELGYRHFDSAMIYGNEDEIGRAISAKIADCTVKREDLFVTNKVLQSSS
jgi:diketogulonate reductase-like aldo/keto reductase